MTTTQNHQNSGGTYAGANFEPMSYDVEEIQPDAYDGEYEATIEKVAFKGTKSKNQPMIELSWKLTGTEDDSENCQKSIGAQVRDWIVLANDRTGNRGKVKLRVLRDTLGLDPDVLPTQISSFDDLAELGNALKGQSMKVWISTSTDNDGNVRTNINYAAPRGASTMAPMGDEEAEVEAPKATSTKGSAKAKPGVAKATKGARR
jgi:hypothetical protein